MSTLAALAWAICAYAANDVGSVAPFAGQAPPPITPRVLLEFAPPSEIEARDLPNDDGSAIVITWRTSPSQPEGVRYTVYYSEGPDGPFKPLPFDFRSIAPDENLMAENLQYFRYRREHRNYHYAIISLSSFTESAVNEYENAVLEYETKKEEGLPTGPEPVLHEYDLDNLYFKLGVTTDGSVRLFDPVLHTQPVEQWFDCGTAESLLETNRHLLTKMAHEPQGDESAFIPPVYVDASATVRHSVIGPNVTIGAGAAVENCVLRDCLIYEGARLTNCNLAGSVIGYSAEVHWPPQQLVLGDYTTIDGG